MIGPMKGAGGGIDGVRMIQRIRLHELISQIKACNRRLMEFFFLNKKKKGRGSEDLI